MNKDEKYNNLTECVVDAQNGVDGSFDALYTMSYPYAYSAASHLLKIQEDIEDALQNSFYYVSKNISGLREPAAYLKWLNTIVINECKKILLEHGKHSKIFFAEKNRLMMNEDSQIIDNNLIEKSDLIETINKMIDEMNPKKSEVLKLYYFENLSYSEISEKLDVPVGTVMSRLHHAKRELEKKIKELQKDGTILWSFPILPLVAALLSYNVKADIPTAVISKSIGTIETATAASATASSSISAAGTTATVASVGASSAGTVATTVGTSVAVKAVAVAVAATVAVGGGIAAKNVVNNSAPISTTTTAEYENVEETSNAFIQSTGHEEPSNTISESYISSTKPEAIKKNNSTASSVQNSSSDSYNNSEPVTTSNSQTKKEDRTRRSSTTTSTKQTTSSTNKTTQSTSRNNEQAETTKSTTSTTATTKIETTTTTTKTETTTTKKEATTTDPTAGFSASGGVINGYSGSEGAVTIPSTVNGEKVTAIGVGAFEGSNITSVSIPSGVTKIGQMSFSDCSNLSSVSLPSTLTSIGDCAFDGCSSLKTITIPNSVTNIGDDAFDGCDNIKIRCSEGSAAYEYAIDNSLDYELI